MSITRGKLRAAAAAYCLVPLGIFLLFWLKAALALPVCAILCYAATRSACCDDHVKFISPADQIGSLGPSSSPGDDRNIRLDRGAMAILLVLAIVWCFLGGQGGLWYQTPDWGIRNAIFRDLITHPWPVLYNDGGAALCYYFGFWLPVAGVGKVLLLAGLPLDVVWPVTNILLLCWTSMGVLLMFLLVIDVLALRGRRASVFACLLLVFFSTPDVLGLLVSGKWNEALRPMHLEWWAAGDAYVGQISSVTACLYWVFNQAVIPWICTLLFLEERDFSRYLLIFAAAFFAGPMPGIGLVALMIAQGIAVLVGGCQHGHVNLGVLVGGFSITNVAGLICCLAVGSFFASNAAVSNTAALQTSVQNILSYPLWFPHNRRMALLALALVVIEGLLIPALCFKHSKRVPVYWGMLFVLVLCPFLRVGQGADFCMRVSIPAVLLMFFFSIRSLILYSRMADGKPQKDVVAITLAVVLALGAATPVFEISRGFVYMSGMLDDSQFSRFEGTSLEGRDFSKSNFGFERPDETPFFKYFGRKPS